MRVCRRPENGTVAGVGSSDNCTEDCLVMWGSEVMDCATLPPDEQPDCMIQAEDDLLSCLRSCNYTSTPVPTTADWVHLAKQCNALNKPLLNLDAIIPMLRNVQRKLQLRSIKIH